MEEITKTIERHIYKLKAINHCAMINFIIPLCTQPVSAGSFLCELICRSSIPIDFIVTNRVTVLTAAIAGVTLDSVDHAILHILHDTNMVGITILAAIIPIEKDNVARARLIAVVLPQSALLEPRHTLRWCWPARSPTGTPRSERWRWNMRRAYGTDAMQS